MLTILPDARLQPCGRKIVANLTPPQINMLKLKLPGLRLSGGPDHKDGKPVKADKAKEIDLSEVSESQAKSRDFELRTLFQPKRQPFALPAAVECDFKDHKLKNTNYTNPSNYNSTRQHTCGKLLGQGTFNTAFAVTYRDPKALHPGATYEAVFKPLSSDPGASGYATGVNLDDPQMAMRNLATVRLAAKLKFDVVPDTEIGTAYLTDSKGVFREYAGLVMEKAPGDQGHLVAKDSFKRADVRRELTKLQLLDHLTGQGDRHFGNYFVFVEPGRTRVTGIDNDQCFGSKLDHPNGAAFDGSGDCPFRGVKLPPMIDTEMAKSIEALKDKEIEQLLGNDDPSGTTSLLKKEEIDATKSRLAVLKQHIADLRKDGRVIDPDHWADPEVQKTFNQYAKPDNSYIARDGRP